MTQPTDTMTPDEARELGQIIADHLKRGLPVTVNVCFGDAVQEIVASWTREDAEDPSPLWTQGDRHNRPGTLDDLKGALRQHAKGAQP